MSNLVRFVLTRDRNACHSGTETPETLDTVPVEISGDTAQLRHVACCVCCDSLNLVTRSLDNSDWRIRHQKWPVWDAFGRIWYERNNQKIIPFHRCETETVPVLFDLQEESCMRNIKPVQ